VVTDSKNAALQVRIPVQRLRAFRAYAVSQGTTMSELVCEWIDRYLAREDPLNARQDGSAMGDECLQLMARQVELLEALVSLQQIGRSSLVQGSR
jgi:hypothetical protein